MQVQKINNQSFGMAVKYSPDYDTVRTFIHTNYNRAINDKVGIMTKLQSNNPVDIYLSIANKDGKKVLRAEVENNTFTEGFWRSAKRVLSGADSYANKLWREQKELDRLLNRC